MAEPQWRRAAGQQVGEARSAVLHDHRVVHETGGGQRTSVRTRPDVGVAEQPQGAAAVDGHGFGPVAAAPHRATAVELGREVARLGGRRLAVDLCDGQGRRRRQRGVGRRVGARHRRCRGMGTADRDGSAAGDRGRRCRDVGRRWRSGGRGGRRGGQDERRAERDGDERREARAEHLRGHHVPSYDVPPPVDAPRVAQRCEEPMTKPDISAFRATAPDLTRDPARFHPAGPCARCATARSLRRGRRGRRCRAGRRAPAVHPDGAGPTPPQGPASGTQR